MKYIKSALEFLAFLQVLFIIYGVCGAYEQDFINELQLIKYLLLFGLALTVNVLGVKALTAASKIKNLNFFESACNRPKCSVMPVRFDYHNKHTINRRFCQCPKCEQKCAVRHFVSR